MGNNLCYIGPYIHTYTLCMVFTEARWFLNFSGHGTFCKIFFKAAPLLLKSSCKYNNASLKSKRFIGIYWIKILHSLENIEVEKKSYLEVYYSLSER